MQSDFAQARRHLERALTSLEGEDETSQRASEAIDLLIEAVAAAEFARNGDEAEIIDLASWRTDCGRGSRG